MKKCNHNYKLEANYDCMPTYWKNLNIMPRGGPWVEQKQKLVIGTCRYCHHRKRIDTTPLILNGDGFEIGVQGNEVIA